MEQTAETNLNVSWEYKTIFKIGNGSAGVVWKSRFCETKSDGKKGPDVIVAMKIQDFGKNFTPRDAEREHNMLVKSQGHPNIIRLISAGFTVDRFYLAMEFLLMDLRRWMKDNVTLTKHQTMSFMKDILSALAHIHSKGVIHGDLKPENMLVTSSCSLKLADFGLATEADTDGCVKYKYPIVTLWYRAPEILLKFSKYTFAIDVWSAGCIFSEIVTGRPLIGANTDRNQLFGIFDALGDPPESWNIHHMVSNYVESKKKIYGKDIFSMTTLSRNPASGKSIDLTRPWLRNFDKEHSSLPKQGLELLRSCLNYVPKERIKAEDALKHVYFGHEPLNPESRVESLRRRNVGRKRNAVAMERDDLPDSLLDYQHVPKKQKI